MSPGAKIFSISFPEKRVLVFRFSPPSVGLRVYRLLHRPEWREWPSPHTNDRFCRRRLSNSTGVNRFSNAGSPAVNLFSVLAGVVASFFTG